MSSITLALRQLRNHLRSSYDLEIVVVIPCTYREGLSDLMASDKTLMSRNSRVMNEATLYTMNWHSSFLIHPYPLSASPNAKCMRTCCLTKLHQFTTYLQLLEPHSDVARNHSAEKIALSALID